MKAFFDAVRPMFGGKLNASQVAGLEALLTATAGLPIGHRAYLLATAKHETADTMLPIREYGRGKGKAYGKVDASGKAPYGRGYVQLTWRENYVKADEKLGLGGALARDYDLALRSDIAAKILVRGCMEGWFTGKKLDDYLPDSFVEARHVVNGKDKAQLIAGYAIEFGKALAIAPPVKPAETAKPADPQKTSGGAIGLLIAALAAVVAWVGNVVGLW